MITYNLIKILKNDLAMCNNYYIFIVILVTLAIFLDIIFSPFWILELIYIFLERCFK